MKARVDAGEFAGPYLHDESQEVARAWGAKTTPDVFVTDASGVVYRGAPDADHGDPSLNAAWLRAALDDVLAGRPVANPRDEAGRLLDQVEVELLYWEGCPSHPAALAELRAALGEDVPVTVREVVDRGAGGRGALPGLADDPRRRRRPVPVGRAAVAHLPHLPAGRRPLLPHPGPGPAARGAGQVRPVT